MKHWSVCWITHQLRLNLQAIHTLFVKCTIYVRTLSAQNTLQVCWVCFTPKLERPMCSLVGAHQWKPREYESKVYKSMIWFYGKIWFFFSCWWTNLRLFHLVKSESPHQLNMFFDVEQLLIPANESFFSRTQPALKPFFTQIHLSHYVKTMKIGKFDSFMEWSS